MAAVDYKNLLSPSVYGKIRFVEDDGGRAAAGFEGTADDCATRAIAIAAELPYKDVHAALTEWQGWDADAGGNGSDHFTCRRFLVEKLGFTWVPLMKVGSGCQVHLREDELPKGRIIVRVSHHFAAVIDGVLHDTHDCSRYGKRCVYGYFKRESIEELIDRSSLGSPEVKATIEDVDPEIVQRILQRADEIAAEESRKKN
jgi:hypothetical protein